MVDSADHLLMLRALNTPLRAGFADRVVEVYRNEFLRVRGDSKHQYSVKVISAVFEGEMSYKQIANRLGYAGSAIITMILNNERRMSDKKWDVLSYQLGPLVNIDMPHPAQWHLCAKIRTISYVQENELDVLYDGPITPQEMVCVERALEAQGKSTMEEIAREVNKMDGVNMKAEDVDTACMKWGPAYMHVNRHLPARSRDQ